MNVASPRNLPDALALLRGATAETRVLAGGTDLMVEFETGRTQPDQLINVWALDELRGIARDKAGLRIGALTTCAELVRDPLVRAMAPILASAADEVGATQIKNRATLGGNLGTASPAADLNPVLCALDARVRLVSSAGARELPVAEFLTGYRTTLRRPDELIEAVWLPDPAPGQRAGFRKVGTRQAQSISKVVVAVALVLEQGSITRLRAYAGSVAECTIELPALGCLVGTRPDVQALAAAARAAARSDARPVDDVRSTEQYRRQTLQRVLVSLLEGLLADAPPV